MTPDIFIPNKAQSADPHLAAYVRRYHMHYTREQITARLLQDRVHPHKIQLAFQAVAAMPAHERSAPVTPAPIARAVPTPAASSRPASSPWKKLFALGGLLIFFGSLAGFELLQRKLNTPEVRKLLGSLQAQARSQNLRDAPSALRFAPAGAAAEKTAAGRRVQVTRAQLERIRNFQAAAQMARQSFRRGRHGDAVRQATEALGLYDEKVHGPGNGRALRRLRAAAYAASGRRKEAERDLREILRTDPGAVGVRYELTRIALEHGDYPAAIRRAGEYIRSSPDAPGGYMLRASAYARTGEYRKAIRGFTGAIKRVGNDERFRGDAATQANLYFNRGALLSNSGKRKSALKDISRAIRLDPSRPAYYQARARLYESYGRHRKAGRDRAKAKRLNASSGAGLRAPTLGVPVSAGRPLAAPSALDLSIGAPSTLDLSKPFQPN